MTTATMHMLGKPTSPCFICGNRKFWLRNKGWGRAEWLCSVCHPCPYDGEIIWYEVEDK